MKATPRLIVSRPSTVLQPRSPNLIPSRQSSNPHPPKTFTRQFSNPLSSVQSLTASRILPYHAAPLYNLIADIPSYPSFLPYCLSSKITSRSSLDPEHKQTWPRTADLRVGWGPYDEVFQSKVYCAPYQVLEAVAGEAKHTIPRDRLSHYYDSGELGEGEGSGEANPIFTSLLTRWTFHEFPFKPAAPGTTTATDGNKNPQEGSASKPAMPRTEVNLVIEVHFASAVYSALSQAAAPKVAGMMVEAFERRAREILGEGHGVGGEGDGGRKGSSALEGVTEGRGLKEEP